MRLWAQIHGPGNLLEAMLGLTANSPTATQIVAA
jgi:hypothetical protein